VLCFYYNKKVIFYYKGLNLINFVQILITVEIIQHGL